MAKIKPDGLSKAVSSTLEQYAGRVTEEVKDSAKKAAKFAVSRLRATSPEKTGAYRKGWRDKAAYEDSGYIRMAVYNKTEYRLAHLLEKGHRIVRGGVTIGMVAPRPHIAPVEREAAERFEKDVIIKIRGIE